MPKRFTDTEIWKQDWFLEMPYEYVMLWSYIKDTCCHAGIWKPNKRIVELIAGKRIDLVKALEFFNKDKERILVLENNRWLIIDFIPFQYGSTLNLANRVHASIYKTLEENNVEMASIRGLLGVKEGVKEKEKDKDSILKREIGRLKTKENKYPYLKNQDFVLAFIYYLQMRVRIRKPTTDHSEDLILKKLHDKYDLRTATAVAEQSEVNSWQGIFDLKKPLPRDVPDRYVRERKDNAFERTKKGLEASKQKEREKIKEITKDIG